MNGGTLMIVGLPGLELDPASRDVLARIRPSGVILFRRNVASSQQLRSLVKAVREVVPEVLLMVDAEGGRVDRLAPVVGVAPSAAALARRGEVLARRAGHWIGSSLAAFDCDVDLAPVVDLDRGERNNALFERTWGAEPETVTTFAAAFLEGLHAAGVAGCIKHFPGLGAAREDTHHHGSEIDLDVDQAARHLEPFRYLAGGAGAVMIGHAAYPVHDPSGLPASVSRAIATDLLRGRLGFEGVAISDDLEMAALAPLGGLPERAAAAVEAGCDLAAVCARLDQAEAVAMALEQVGEARLREAAARLARWRHDIDQLSRHRRSGSRAITRARAGLERLRSSIDAR